MRMKLQAKTLHSDHYGVSEQATSTIASSMCQHFGLIAKKYFPKLSADKGKSQQKWTMTPKWKGLSITSWYLSQFEKKLDLSYKNYEIKALKKMIKEETCSIIKELGSS